MMSTTSLIEEVRRHELEARKRLVSMVVQLSEERNMLAAKVNRLEAQAAVHRDLMSQATAELIATRTRVGRELVWALCGWGSVVVMGLSVIGGWLLR